MECLWRVWVYGGFQEVKERWETYWKQLEREELIYEGLVISCQESTYDSDELNQFKEKLADACKKKLSKVHATILSLRF